MTTNKSIEQKLQLCPRLPTLSGVAIELVSAARDPAIEMNEITRLISNDPALAARLLRVANSSLYKRYSEVQTLEQAIWVLGLNTAITLSLNFSLTACLHKYRSPGIDLDHFWRRALISAMAARLLGQTSGAEKIDELFLAALLQDMGRLALDAALPDEYAATQDTDCDHDSRISHERDAFGTEHLEAGAWLAEEWRLPDYLRLAILGSHDTSERSEFDAETRLFVGCVAASGRVADIVLANDTDQAIQHAEQVASDCLRLPPKVLAGIINDLVNKMPEIEQLFETSLLTAEQADGLTQKAQELIACHNLRRLDAAIATPKSDSEFKQLADQLYEVAHRDALTGLFNRRHFDEALESAIADSGGTQLPLSVAYMDLDHFKSINDQHGHLAGDAMLRTTAQTLENCVRPRDLLARYGGEEFVILLPGLTSPEVHQIIERIRDRIEALVTDIDDTTQLSTTLSAGIACYQHIDTAQTSPADLMKAADYALYQAKDTGRNKIVVAQ